MGIPLILIRIFCLHFTSLCGFEGQCNSKFTLEDAIAKAFCSITGFDIPSLAAVSMFLGQRRTSAFMYLLEKDEDSSQMGRKFLPNGSHSLELLFSTRWPSDRVKEAFYVGPSTKDKIPKNCPEGSVLLGAISQSRKQPSILSDILFSATK